MSKERKIIGYWDGEPITRDETPEETLKRELALSGFNVTNVDVTSVAELFKKLSQK